MFKADRVAKQRDGALPKQLAADGDYGTYLPECCLACAHEEETGTVCECYMEENAYGVVRITCRRCIHRDRGEEYTAPHTRKAGCRLHGVPFRSPSLETAKGVIARGYFVLPQTGAPFGGRCFRW